MASEGDSAMNEDGQGKPIREGLLFKKGKINKSWKKRYFVLYEGRKLSYFEKHEDYVKKKNPAGAIDLSGVQSIHLIPTQESHQKMQNKETRKTTESLSDYHSNGLLFFFFFFFPPPLSDFACVCILYIFMCLCVKKKKKKKKRVMDGGYVNFLQRSNTGLADGGTTLSEDLYGSGDDSTPIGSPRASDTNNNINKQNGSDLKKKQRLPAFVDKDFAFAIVTAKRTFVLCAKDSTDLEGWRYAIENATFGGRLFQGWLTKRGEKRKSWKKRWFVIFDTHEMRYYDNEHNMQSMGVILLRQVLLICPGDPEQYTLRGI
ncbi:hypothetical protein RFI_21024 [Reticulomyxa filosa]|uniref:PH domain-containing protein n=1 Tax=Reticulomyxa filosa TaxID=46433 RepID=X6MR51_RETFI|nr:hypothetical protein RFI_21024 [Reticulomyxa filosa]|eukprot:ETO16329.1 hypothetical protein RFI_21024 [Reticulomyxa filosa]